MTDAREQQIAYLKSAPLDVLILGGGINGAGVARDLMLRAHEAGMALRVGLVEQGHFASGTSGKNSQLIHGGLRYLKGFAFGLVREALRERAILMDIAPEMVRPLRFLMPFYGRMEGLYYEAGLTMYDLLAGRRNIARHSRLGRRATVDTEPRLAADGLTGGALFWDGHVNAARFVLANISDARRHGAAAVNYVCAETWAREAGEWRVELRDMLFGQRFEVRARKLVDTRGPWSGAGALRLVRGSHLVLPRLTTGGHAIAHFNPDGRILFVIPWGETQPLSLVGTTDVDHDAGPADVHISAAEASYLLGAVRRLFPAVRDMEPIAAFSALRPLVAGERGAPSEATREHRIWNTEDGVLHVAGGKYTTYRSMSEEAADIVASEIAPPLARPHPTRRARLPQQQAPASERERIEFAVTEEMARRLPDLIFVSTYWGYEQQWTRERLEPLALEMGRLLGWDRGRIEEEIGLVLCQAAPWRS